MKILMLVPFLPNTETSGGQTRWYNIIRYLSRNHDITLFSMLKDENERRFIPELKKYCSKVKVFKRSKSPWSPKNILLAELGFYPLVVIRNFSLAERREVKRELQKEKYDLIHAEAFYVMPHIPKTNVPIILVEQTIEYMVYKHYVDNKVPFYLKPFYILDVLKLKYWEKHYWKKADQLVAVSQEDKLFMNNLIPGIGVDIIPNGVDSHHFRQKMVKKDKPERVLYGVSNFEWMQNQEAAENLINEVWPKIRNKRPDVKVQIAGRKIPQWLSLLAKEREDVEVAENVKEARDTYAKASIMVAPIKGSGGTRLKILEAMASGLPVVSTSVGVAGLKVSSGDNVLISDTYEGLAKHALRLLENPHLSEKIGKNGQEFVRKYFDWKEIVKLHDPIYEKVIKKEK